MRENRRHIRYRMPAYPPKIGRIITDPKKPTIECRIVDMSASGACIEVSSEAAIPKKFALVTGGIKKKCNLVWRQRNRLGVSY